MALLLLARALVAWVPFSRWNTSLGKPVDPQSTDPTLRLPHNLAARRLARAVERAAARLPGGSKCLPRAMALQWLLHRRGLGAVLQFGVRPGERRGGLDDLHAWVTRDGEVLIGASKERHHAVLAMSAEP
jgi:hypothetical protein